jgi:phosphoribosylformimino-5-aminoimidazole carboxamide ribotide isomerase
MDLSSSLTLFPAIDLRAGRCVRLRQGDYAQETVFGDHPAEMAARWQAEGAPWLHLVDLDGAKAGRPVNLDALRAIRQALQIPCQLGGGIRDESAIRLMLDDVGIDRVIVGTQALKQPGWFRSMCEAYPGKLVLGIDARGSMVATEGWLDVSQTPALELARQYAGMPLAALVYTNIANDGMMQGIDPATLEDMVALANLGFPVIASGGVTTLEDLRNLVAARRRAPSLSGAIIGRALYEGTIRLADALQITAG